jgi:ABC-type phosphate transport system substrate-binding protein
VLNSQVHTVSIDGYAATQANIENGHYTFWSYEHMYTLSIPTGGAVDTFLNFMLTNQVQQQASALHYIPISSLQFPQLSALPQQTGQPAAALVDERKRYVL